MAALALDSAVRRAPGVYAEDVRLSRPGTWVFARLGDAPQTIADLAPRFAAAFGVPPAQAVEDVQLLLADLLRRGLAVPA
jgi:hypothetical protein